ncbi:MAG TPA: MXAN_5187 C-terminal domain-containing protein [Pyrinomonadaceae bacterium]|nr:MXAN_5187 C-terminal domain-containing protein [Pyrinomonadaceae bacterium]
MSIRENKFARRAKERDARREKKGLVFDTPPSVDEQLGRLEEDIRRLKVEFDIYFNGAAKRPPYDTKGRVETIIKRLADDRTLTFAQRYRYNSLTAHYTSFLQLWRRTMQEREEGRGPHAPRHTHRPAPQPQAAPSVFVCADARNDVATVKTLFHALVEAKKRCGEPTDELSFPRFHRMVAEKSEALKSRAGCERVHFSVAVHEGRVSFKAKAEK